MTRPRQLWNILRRPGPAFIEAIATGQRGLGLKAALLTGALWAVFLAALVVHGHQPSGPLLLPIPRADYYAWEALFVVPTYVAMFYAFSGVMHRFARGWGGQAPWNATQAVAGLTIAISSLGGWWFPDIVVYATAGFSALGEAMRFYVPVSVISAWILGTVGLRRVHDLTTGRAFISMFAGWVAQTLVGTPFLR